MDGDDWSAKLVELRKRTGLSARATAAAIGWNYTTYLEYEKGKIRQDHLPMKLARPLSREFAKHGVAPREVLLLAGLPPQAAVAPDFPPDFDVDEVPPQPPLQGEAIDGVPMMRISELDVSAAAGFEHGLDAENHYEGQPEPIVAEWQMPRDLVHGITAATGGSLRIIRVKGTSMMPDYMPGERVLVDLQDKVPSPAGPFVIWDGLALVVKYIELVPGSDPATVKLISRNEVFGTYERPLADVHINGRVVGKWQWS